MGNSSVTSAVNTTCLFNEEFLTTMMPPTLTIFFILAAGLNAFSFWVLCFQIKKKTPIDILMLNLCGCDLLMALTYPLLITYYSKDNHWIFGNFMCKLHAFITFSSVLASVLFLACISSYRCYMIVKPVQAQYRITKKCTIALSATIWLVTCGFMSLIFRMVNVFQLNGKLHCISFNEAGISKHLLPSTIQVFVLGFLIPFGFLLVSTILIRQELAKPSLTSQSQQRGQHAVKMMAVVLFIFTICFLPTVVSRFLIATVDRRNCSLFQKLGIAYYSSLLCLYLNGILDPIVYYYAGTKYRSKIIQVMKSWKSFKKPMAASSILNVSESTL
ncbi:hydroxycarboxylic acid receptor 3-like [Scyliorhinus torazame]|uniref:hydroxycarboxylic acid receptor 3-like n=1 Tax=Scyliorhinus torazame TaxID=75743 RepID=UPI003B5C9C37